MSRSSRSTSLVIGSDGLLGRRLFTRLSQAGESVWGTSRRNARDASRIIHLDLGETSPELALPQRVHVAFLCAAVTSMEACETDPERTRQVNVTNTLRVAEQLLHEGIFVQFLSTSAVFDGATPYPGEASPICATTEYGRQKAEAEQRLLDLDRGRGFVNIARLSKVIASTTPLVRRFLGALTQGKPVEAFSDVRLSPVSLNYVTDLLIASGRKRLGGILHFSGAAELSYADLAVTLTRYLGVAQSLVTPVNARKRGAIPLFCPVHPALGMARTTEKLAVSPQPLDEVLREVLSDTSTGPFS